MRTHLFETRRDQRRGNILSNSVWIAVLAIALVGAGSLTGLFDPWAETMESFGETASDDVLWTIQRPGQEPRVDQASGSPHAFFGIEDEQDAKPTSKAVRAEHVAGNWSTATTDDCAGSPMLSITLREGMTAIFGFGTVALNACENELKYAVVEGTILDDRVVLTITNDTAGKLLYVFEGTLTDDGLVGNLTESDGGPTASIVLSRS